jgi:membrane protease subunit (stomatin/prohibitin family)
MDNKDKMEYYLSIGAIELAGVDQEGEFIFNITNKAKRIAPELWQAHEDHVNESLVQLYEKGLISVTYNDDLEAIIEMSDEGKTLAKEMGLIEMDIDNDIPND